LVAARRAIKKDLSTADSKGVVGDAAEGVDPAIRHGAVQAIGDHMQACMEAAEDATDRSACMGQIRSMYARFTGKEEADITDEEVVRTKRTVAAVVTKAARQVTASVGEGLREDKARVVRDRVDKATGLLDRVTKPLQSSQIDNVAGAIAADGRSKACSAVRKLKPSMATVCGVAEAYDVAADAGDDAELISADPAAKDEREAAIKEKGCLALANKLLALRVSSGSTVSEADARNVELKDRIGLLCGAKKWKYAVTEAKKKFGASRVADCVEAGKKDFAACRKQVVDSKEARDALGLKADASSEAKDEAIEAAVVAEQIEVLTQARQVVAAAPATASDVDNEVVEQVVDRLGQKNSAVAARKLTALQKETGKAMARCLSRTAAKGDACSAEVDKLFGAYHAAGGAALDLSSYLAGIKKLGEGRKQGKPTEIKPADPRAVDSVVTRTCTSDVAAAELKPAIEKIKSIAAAKGAGKTTELSKPTKKGNKCSVVLRTEMPGTGAAGIAKRKELAAEIASGVGKLKEATGRLRRDAVFDASAADAFEDTTADGGSGSAAGDTSAASNVAVMPAVAALTVVLGMFA
jgi:hypothetical protein